MPDRDLFQDMDNWGAEQDGDDSSGQAPADDKADDSVAGFSLEALAASGSEFAQAFAKELLELRQARSERAAREAEVADAEAALEAGVIDFESADGLAAATLLAEQRRAETLESFKSLTRKDLIRQLGPGATAAEVEAGLAGAMKAQQAVEEFMGPAGPHDLPEYRAHLVGKAQKAKAEQAATEMLMARSPGWGADVEAAESGIEAVLRDTLS
jgi:hypothetical protein